MGFNNLATLLIQVIENVEENDISVPDEDDNETTVEDNREEECTETIDEYDSSSSSENEEGFGSGSDNGDEVDWGVPKEQLFLVGGRSRFGRAVRMNGKYI